MKIIGISLGSNSSACVVSAENGVEFAVSEERLINEKNTKNFPINALDKCFKFIKQNEPTQEKYLIMVSFYETVGERTIKYIKDWTFEDIVEGNMYETFKNYVSRKTNISKDKLDFKRVEHHEAHRLPAIYMSGFDLDNTIAITCDGFGDGLSGTIFDCSTHEILARMELQHSLALIYQFVTGVMGFKEHQDEGKITGLAAYGSPLYVDNFMQELVCYNVNTNSFVSHYAQPNAIQTYNDCKIPYNKNIHAFNLFLNLKKATRDLVFRLKMRGAKDEDIAASVQSYIELLMIVWIKQNVSSLNEGKEKNLVLSGGIFCNVKLVFKLQECFNCKSIYVFPATGDEGTCVGAAIKGLIMAEGILALNLRKFAKNDLYLGKYVHVGGNLSDDFPPVLTKGGNNYLVYNIKNEWEVDVARQIAKYLKDYMVVCIARGNLEFGGRALGNHSILCKATSKETNSWLNSKLNRTEFMPYAPIVLDKFADDLFYNIEGLEKALRYMCTDVLIKPEFKKYKAVYHIDNTARPQVLHREDNSFLYDILYRYYEETDEKALINTSFNMHGMPMVSDDETAVETFVQSGLDVLVLENIMLVKHKK